MKGRTTIFTQFTDGLFPPEVAYVRGNNQFEDPDYFAILERMAMRVAQPENPPPFDPGIDPRKYSRLKKAFERKLEAIDVDAYYGWISRVNHLIQMDAIPPAEQARILREMEAFQPGWFHAASFYRTISTYEFYLLMRFREKDHQTVQAFLEKHRDAYEENERVLAEIKSITSQLVKGDEGPETHMAGDGLDHLLTYFRDVRLSKKTRYQAWLAIHMHHNHTRQMAPLEGPLRELEAHIFQGDFYSRRIAANFYANKLLVLSHLGKYEEAAYCGLQSIKHRTEDYLYYLNNYCSVLMHLGRYVQANTYMKAAYESYKETRDKGRRIVFAANYCRSLNATHEHQQGARVARSLIEELGVGIFKFRWHYLFRVYFQSLLVLEQGELILRYERKHRLTDHEKRGGFAPYIEAAVLVARYRELKIPEKTYQQELTRLRAASGTARHKDLKAMLSSV